MSAYTLDADQFAKDCADAKATGQPFRTECDMLLGWRVVMLTPDEIAAAQAATAQEASQKASIGTKKIAAIAKLAAAGISPQDIRDALNS